MRSLCLLAWLLLPMIQATPVHWTLAPTKLAANAQPGLTGFVSGDFFYDAQTNAYSAWSLTVSGLTPPADALNRTLTPGNSYILIAAGDELGVQYTASPSLLHLRFTSLSSFGSGSLTDAGGTVGASILGATFLPSFGSFNVYGSSTVTGEPSGNTVPEPAAGVLVLLGAVALCFCNRR